MIPLPGPSHKFSFFFSGVYKHTKHTVCVSFSSHYCRCRLSVHFLSPDFGVNKTLMLIHHSMLIANLPRTTTLIIIPPHIMTCTHYHRHHHC